MSRPLGIFGDETIRLLRERWTDANMLAEELFSIFTGTDPINIPAGSTLQPPATGETRLNIPDFTFGDTIFNLTGKSGQPLASVTLNSDGLKALAPGGAALGGGSSTPTPAATTSTFPGKVTGGSGSTYTVDIYPNGLAGAAVSVSVTQLQIDAAATIPVGTWTLVTKTSDNTYQMQVPVWL